MSIHFQPPTIDLLADAIERVRPHVDRTLPIGHRIRALWAGAVAAHKLNLGAIDVIEAEFTKLARATGITADLGRHGDEDVAHIIRWAFLNRNPFGQ
jgi:hypothetical protein